MVKLNTLETLGSILACLGHDVAHPGVTNRFLVNIKDDLALHYNDNSVLENMHCATIYSLMQKSGCDLLSSLGQEDWFHVRNIVIGMVLATDMSKHFEFIGQFRARVIKLRDMEISELEDKSLAMSMGIKCADLGHSAKSLDLHRMGCARRVASCSHRETWKRISFCRFPCTAIGTTLILIRVRRGS